MARSAPEGDARPKKAKRLEGGDGRRRRDVQEMGDDSAALEVVPTLDSEPDTEVDEGEASCSSSEEQEKAAGRPAVFRPGVDSLGENEVLTYDPSAYDTYHKFGLGDSCFAMDIVADNLGAARVWGPHTIYLVAGTQSEHKQRRTWQESSDAEESDDSDDETASEPVLSHTHIQIDCAINCIKMSPHVRWLCAAYGEDSRLRLYNLQNCLSTVDNPATFCDPVQKPCYEYTGCYDEGFGLAWNPNRGGQIALGSRDASIRLLDPVEGGWTDGAIFKGHKASVEGVSWKVDDANVLASCSADHTVRIWDTRDSTKSQLVVAEAHQGDVNAVSFRPMEETNHFLTGGDDGAVSVRDLRMADELLFHQKFHKQPVNVVDWHPTDNSMFFSSSYDDTIAIWSMDVEAGAGELAHDQPEELDFFPKQLLFLHMGQSHVSAARWHPQIKSMIVSTAEDGLNIFRPEDLTNSATA